MSYLFSNSILDEFEGVFFLDLPVIGDPDIFHYLKLVSPQECKN